MGHAFVLCSDPILHTQGGAWRARHAFSGSGYAHARAALNLFFAGASLLRQGNEPPTLAHGEGDD